MSITHAPEEFRPHGFLHENGSGHWATDALSLQRTINSLGLSFLPLPPSRNIHHSILQLSSCCLSWHCHTVNCLPRRAGGYFRGRQMKRVIDVTMLQCSHLPSLHPSFTWDLPGHTTNNYAFPPAQSSFILECGETQFKPEIRSQERLAAKLVGEVASRASQPVVNLEFENHDDYRLMRE